MSYEGCGRWRNAGRNDRLSAGAPAAGLVPVGLTELSRAKGRGGIVRRDPSAYSHSIVAGGFDETSSATRLTCCTSLMIRPETRSSRS